MKSKSQTRHLLVSIPLVIFLFVATSCHSGGSSGNDLEARVNNLQTEINSLMSTNEKLRNEVDNLTTNNKPLSIMLK